MRLLLLHRLSLLLLTVRMARRCLLPLPLLLLVVRVVVPACSRRRRGSRRCHLRRCCCCWHLTVCCKHAVDLCHLRHSIWRRVRVRRACSKATTHKTWVHTQLRWPGRKSFACQVRDDSPPSW